jgi:hypothetical protein
MVLRTLVAEQRTDRGERPVEATTVVTATGWRTMSMLLSLPDTSTFYNHHDHIC